MAKDVRFVRIRGRLVPIKIKSTETLGPKGKGQFSMKTKKAVVAPPSSFKNYDDMVSKMHSYAGGVNRAKPAEPSSAFSLFSKKMYSYAGGSASMMSDKQFGGLKGAAARAAKPLSKAGLAISALAAVGAAGYIYGKNKKRKK